MRERNTLPSDASVVSHLAAIEDASRRADCEALVALMARVTQEPAVMWGPSIVGFSSRKGDISLCVLSGDAANENLLASLGKHRRSKGCLYVRRLSDINLDVLAGLVALACAKSQP